MDELFSKIIEHSNVVVSKDIFNNILLDKANKMFDEMENFILTLENEIK
jgi:hypothetical protein